MPTIPKTDSPDPYDSVGAWFLGPRGENLSSLMNLLSQALHYHVQGREAYFPDDPVAITTRMKTSDIYQKNMQKLFILVKDVSQCLSRSSVPFWSPRYNAHMNMDTSMPGIVGYFTGMLANPNNVATEASPLTTRLEVEVGKQLCELVGFNTDDTKQPLGWGHTTCGGTVANLESMWAARNLKFYPLSLRLALQAELRFIADTFCVRTCDQSDETEPDKLLKDFTTWELLNITPSEVFEIPARLNHKYGITPAFLQKALDPYSIQTVGKDYLERQFGIDTPSLYFASATMHYSWPKGAAITGIGRTNVRSVLVDESARMDTSDLREQLERCLEAKQAVYAVVAIMGSTEHGACDPLKDIVSIRDEFRKRGLSFALHGDGAWGTYYVSTIPKKIQKTFLKPKLREMPRDDFVPTLPLKSKTIESLVHLRYCDSITVDPHKSGYIQYPAGGLLYRDNRMRYLVTWTSPIVYRGGESIGVYGVEGSKPGAAPLAVWATHEIIGLNPEGYGQLLGQATFSAVKKMDFIVTPLNLLPAEEHGDDVEAQKKFIRERIVPESNRDLVADPEAWRLVLEMGSDLSINAFAVNFKIDGRPNDDIYEANYLNKRIFERLSITKELIAGEINDKPLILTSTQLAQKSYGRCLSKFKERLQLPQGSDDLYVLVNVVMSPWPTASGLTNEIANTLHQIIREERQVLEYRNTLTPDLHGFVMQGTGDRVFLVHLAMFNMENHRRQLIISGKLPDDVMKIYVDARRTNKTDYFTLRNAVETTLDNIMAGGKLEAIIDIGIPTDPDGRPHLAQGLLTDIQVVAERSLRSRDLVPYPTTSVPFFLYGSDTQLHIDHVYTASPNIQLSADQVQRPLVYAHLPYPEVALQPFPQDKNLANTLLPSRFSPGGKFDDVIFTADLKGEERIGSGSITLSQEKPLIDTEMLNMDPKLPSPNAEHATAKAAVNRNIYWKDFVVSIFFYKPPVS
ncbi:PLP-dependent transferase [Ceratobasidium sp. AG-I]|nr:PLP-dependent transferase [Ceratobasidium sp. AG-I]